MVRCYFVILLTRCFVVVFFHRLTRMCTYCSVNKYNQSSYQVVNLTEICVDSECLTQNWVNNLGIWATLVRLVTDASWSWLDRDLDLASTIAAILVARAADAFKGRLKEFLVGFSSFTIFFLFPPQPGRIAAQWVGCLPLPQPHLHRDNTVWLSGCRQGFIMAEISKLQINPKTPGVRLHSY